MPTVDFMGKTFTVDEDGFIDSYENWSQEWVQWVKKEEGIEELNDEHQKVIDVLRDYYEKNGIAPMVRRAEGRPSISGRTIPTIASSSQTCPTPWFC